MENNEVNQEYTIKIIPSQGDTVHSIRLPANLLKYGLASFGVGAFLLVGAFGYAVYSTFLNRNGAEEIEELRQVNSIQQEQMLMLSKKATAMQDELDQLRQMENELRRMSGSSAAQDDGAGVQEGSHDGQGGPYTGPDVQSLHAALDIMEKRLAVRKNSMEGLRQELKVQQEKLVMLGGFGMGVMGGVNASTPSIWPTSGEVSSPYGLRWGGTDFHPGIDIANDMGTPIVATADGIVTTAGWNSGGYGNMVDIDHGNGIMTRYAHASQVIVVAGQHVRKGQLIAYMGSTGFSTGPHVHYEVRINGQTVNPVGYL